MEPAEQRNRITAEQFAQLDVPPWTELVRGEVVEMPRPSALHGKIQFRLATWLGRFLMENPLGEGFTESGFTVERGPDVVRGPDVSFVSAERLEGKAPDQTYLEGAPDLAVEIVSPNDKVVDLDEKIAEYFAAGARAVWVVNPTTERVVAHTSAKLARIYTAEDTLDGGEILPGFELPLAQLFA